MARVAIKPPMFLSLSTRSPSISSTTIRRSDSSISIPGTAATSNADVPSVSTPMNNEDVFIAAAEAGANVALAEGQSGRVKRVRKSLLASYNENVLSGTAKRKRMDKASGRTASGETLVAGLRQIVNC